MEDLLRSLANQLQPLKVIGPGDITHGREGERITDGRLDLAAACYIDPGPYPYVCGRCDSFNGGDCEYVDGPDQHQVSPTGSCKLWSADEALVKPPEIPEIA